MPEPIEPAPLTDKERAEWRAEFKKRGREAIRDAIYTGQGLQPHKKRVLAIEWLREKEASAERRERATFWIAVAVLVLTIIGVTLDAYGLLGSSQP